MATLAIYRGDQFQRRIDLDERPMRIGRAPENELVLPDASKGVSRAHAEIRFEEGRYIIADLNSQNGVWLGDRRVKRDALPLDAPVTIGPYRLVMESKQAAAPMPIPQDALPVVDPQADVEPAEPTQLVPGASPTPRRVPVTPPAPSQRRGVPFPALIAGALVVVGLSAWAVVMLRRPDAPVRPLDPPPATSSVAPEPPPAPPQAPDALTMKQYDEAMLQARDLFDKKDKQAAMTKAAEALAIKPQDPEAVRLSVEIAQLPDQPEPATTEPQPAPGSTGPPNGEVQPAKPTVAPPPPSTLTVAVIPRERQSVRRERQKSAEGALLAGIRQFEQGQFAEAGASLQRALKDAGRPDFGRTRNEAQAYLDRARQALETQEVEEKNKRVQDLVSEARRVAPTDVAKAISTLRAARALDATASGVNDLMPTLEEQARAQALKAFREAKNLDLKKRYVESAREYTRVVQLLAAVPGGMKEELDYATKRLQELREPQ